ncbi:hypothetical protein AB0M13_03190 [Nocardia fluminea]|uniref:hypothetical protein n=1 Tax=Nocardia fluminea TaxID=134984 RepID=UPI00341751D4
MSRHLHTAAGTTFRTGVNAGADNGFTQSDTDVYDAAADARHWTALTDLFTASCADPATTGHSEHPQPSLATTPAAPEYRTSGLPPSITLPP